MTTTDKLTDQIAKAIHDGPAAQSQYLLAGIAPHSARDCPHFDQYREDAAAVMQLVREAQADALREFADEWQDTADHNTPADIDPERLRERADQIEEVQS